MLWSITSGAAGPPPGGGWLGRAGGLRASGEEEKKARWQRLWRRR